MKKILFVLIGAQMGVLLAAPTVTDVVAKQRYPWNGLVDITCKVTGIEKSAPYKFFIDAVQVDEGITNKISTFWVVQNGTKQSNFMVAANDVYHLIWDSKADLGDTYCMNMIVRVAIDCEQVQLWEGGPYWATTNIGAQKPEDSGYYFWWGDTVGYKRENNSWVASDGSNSNFSFVGSNASTSYKSNSTLLSDGMITSVGILSPEYDAANVHWGNGWRLPTKAELDSLLSNCDWALCTTNGVDGYIVRGKGAYSSHSIFLPSSGLGIDTSLVYYGSWGIWSSVSVLDDNYCSWFLYHDGGPTEKKIRDCGLPIRPLLGPIPATYVVTFNANGGEGSTMFTCMHGETLGGLPSPIREGYSFSGWWTAVSGGTEISSSTIVSGDAIYYAHWNRITYTVEFNANGGDGGCIQSSVAGSALGSLPVPAREGYIFAGWWTASRGGLQVDASTIVTGNVTYYAHWEDSIQLWDEGPYWAITNIGAKNPWDSGYHFWWGDIIGYKRENNKWVASDGSTFNFSFSNGNAPTHGKSISTLQSEGWITSDGVLAPEYDAATVHLGSGWRMPTKDEFDALNSKCDWIWTTTNGVNGYIVKGRGVYLSKSIFLPAAGLGTDTSLGSENWWGGYWLSSLYSNDDSWHFCLYPSTYYKGVDERYYGQCVRPLKVFTK